MPPFKQVPDGSPEVIPAVVKQETNKNLEGEKSIEDTMNLVVSSTYLKLEYCPPLYSAINFNTQVLKDFAKGVPLPESLVQILSKFSLDKDVLIDDVDARWLAEKEFDDLEKRIFFDIIPRSVREGVNLTDYEPYLKASALEEEKEGKFFEIHDKFYGKSGPFYDATMAVWRFCDEVIKEFNKRIIAVEIEEDTQNEQWYERYESKPYGLRRFKFNLGKDEKEALKIISPFVLDWMQGAHDPDFVVDYTSLEAFAKCVSGEITKRDSRDYKLGRPKNNPFCKFENGKFEYSTASGINNLSFDTNTGEIEYIKSGGYPSMYTAASFLSVIQNKVFRETSI